MTLRRKLTIALLAASGALTVSPLAWAQSPHFITATGAVQSNGDYLAQWKEAGLGNCPPNGECTYNLTASVESTWQCFNNGNNQPQGAPNSGGPSPASSTGSFPPSHNGTISASLSLSPNSDGISCQGNGLKLCLTAVSYSNVVLSDVTFSPPDTVALPSASAEIPPPSKNNPGTCE